jgi:hypothetical protein
MPSSQHDRLPIKLIMPKQGLERRVSGGGGKKKGGFKSEEQRLKV